MPSGAYSVSVYQDRNGNKELDTNLFGVPTEAYGFSNDARGLLSKPSFDDARVTVDEDTSIANTIK